MAVNGARRQGLAENLILVLLRLVEEVVVLRTMPITQGLGIGAVS